MELKKWIGLLNKPFAAAGAAGKQAGMTIIEILIVIALLGTIMTIVMTNILDKSDDAKEDLAKVAAAQLENALRLYKLHNNRYPTTEEGLGALVTQPASAKNWRGPYTEADKLNDPWGVPFTYEASGVKNFKITSAGKDQEMGTADDVIYPPEAGGEKPAQ